MMIGIEYVMQFYLENAIKFLLIEYSVATRNDVSGYEIRNNPIRNSDCLQ